MKTKLIQKTGQCLKSKLDVEPTNQFDGTYRPVGERQIDIAQKIKKTAVLKIRKYKNVENSPVKQQQKITCSYDKIIRLYVDWRKYNTELKESH